MYMLATAIFAVNAQDNIEIYVTGQSTDISGGTHNVVAPDLNSFDVSFDVHNNTGTTYQWRITRVRMDIPIGWKDGLCWGHATDPFGGTCYSSEQMAGDSWTSPGTANVLFDIADGEYGKMKASIDPDDYVSGTAHYRYYITQDGVENMDSVDLIVDFTASIKEVKEEVSVSIAPNPATDYININLTSIDNASVKIVDVLGNVVFKETAIGSTKKIDLTNFKNGVYFVIIESSGLKPITRKVVIRH